MPECGLQSACHGTRCLLRVVACAAVGIGLLGSVAASVDRSASSGARPRPSLVVLLLPGVTLDDLLLPELHFLPRLVRTSSGAWVAVWRETQGLERYGKSLKTPLRRDASRPYGVAADVDATGRAARRELRRAPILWIDLGDTARAARYAPLCAPDLAEKHRRTAMQDADRLLGELLRQPSLPDVWVIAPPAAPESGLVPFFWMRRGFGPGLLRSGSTHMTGVITGPDLVATLADVAGEPYDGDGRQAEVVPWPGAVGRARSSARAEPGPLGELHRLWGRVEGTEEFRPAANRLIQWLLLLCLVTAILALQSGRRLPTAITLLPLLLPPLLLADGARRGGALLLAMTLALLPGAAQVWAASRSRRFSGQPSEAGMLQLSWRPLAAAGCAACALALLSGDCLPWSALSYSIPLGVRFYGIGNELMGWWIGVTLLAVSGGNRERIAVGPLCMLLAVAVLIGHPSFGANVGGGVTALGAVGVLLWPWLRGRPVLMAAMVCAVVMLLVGMAAWDASRPLADQTHLGRLALRVAHEGPGPLLSMAGGKLWTNLRISVGLWGVMVAAGIRLVLLAQRRAPQSATTRAVALLLPTAILAFLVNDSGVIAAALMLSLSVLAVGPQARRNPGPTS
jgi:hypothetical protein